MHARVKAITIEVAYNNMKVHEEKKKRSRLVWYAAGLEVYVLGALKGGLYGQAANLAMNYAESIHIPASALKSAYKPYTPHTQTSGLTNGDGYSLKKKLF